MKFKREKREEKQFFKFFFYYYSTEPSGKGSCTAKFSSILLL